MGVEDTFQNRIYLRGTSVVARSQNNWPGQEPPDATHMSQVVDGVRQMLPITYGDDPRMDGNNWADKSWTTQFIHIPQDHMMYARQPFDTNLESTTWYDQWFRGIYGEGAPDIAAGGGVQAGGPGAGLGGQGGDQGGGQGGAVGAVGESGGSKGYSGGGHGVGSQGGGLSGTGATTADLASVLALRKKQANRPGATPSLSSGSAGNRSQGIVGLANRAGGSSVGYSGSALSNSLAGLSKDDLIAMIAGGVG